MGRHHKGNELYNGLSEQVRSVVRQKSVRGNICGKENFKAHLQEPVHLEVRKEARNSKRCFEFQEIRKFFPLNS
jgi:hypothetical protein